MNHMSVLLVMCCNKPMIGGNVINLTQRQWQMVEACVRKEQTKNVNNQPYYKELHQILDELYKLAHG